MRRQINPCKALPRRGLTTCFVIATLFCVPSGFVSAQDNTETAAEQPDTVLVVRTGSPQQTLQSWLDHTQRAEDLTRQAKEEQTRADFSRVAANARRLLSHLDLSQTPAAVRNEAGFRATYALQDILMRVAIPPMDEVPDWDAFDEASPGRWRLPGTPITIVRMDEGPRAGEYLFSASTVADAPGFYNRISHSAGATAHFVRQLDGSGSAADWLFDSRGARQGAS